MQKNEAGKNAFLLRFLIRCSASRRGLRLHRGPLPLLPRLPLLDAEEDAEQQHDQPARKRQRGHEEKAHGQTAQAAEADILQPAVRRGF